MIKKLISIISILLSASGKLSNINQYLNTFNFMIYFVIGILINKISCLLNLVNLE